MASLEINNLGKFADMSAVWSTHPEGGREGDFLTIGQRRYNWDLIERQWKSLDDETAPGGPASETITGDLTVGGDLHVGGDAEIDGDVTINGELHLPNGERYKGQSIYRSIVFARSNNRPDTPSGGSFANPLPDGNVWKDGIPSGTRPIWMSSRVFTSDDKAPATSSWTVPALMSDAENFDVEFSPAATNTVPPPPMSGSNGNLGWLWFDPVRNPNADWDKMNWMATRTQSQGVWGDWTIVLIKGETGDGVQSVFTVTNGSIPSISGTSYPPSGWYKSVNNLTVDHGDVLWMSERRFESGNWSSWSTPVRLNGVDGEPGEDGPDIEFIYKQMNRLPNTGGYTDDPPESVNVDKQEPLGWNDHPSGVDAGHLYEWMCQRIKPAGTNSVWGNWVGPFVWSAWGERGMDGDGIEFVFIRSKVNIAPGIINDDSRSDSHSPQKTPSDNGYLPGATWSGATATDLEQNGGTSGGYEFTDNPTGVSGTWPYEWVSKRKKVNGAWQNFSPPALWSTYSEEHTVDINDDGYWVIDGVPTNKRATGFAIDGSVDFYSTTSEGWTSGKTTLEDVSSPSQGDCWLVGSNGHVYMCVNPSGATLAAKWRDIGQFKGDPGTSQFVHIAWATKINTSGSTPSLPAGESWFKNYSDKDPSKNYEWMGICVNETESDSSLSVADYNWNYLKGLDGVDVEYVYIRTKTKDTAPTIAQTAVQSPEGQEEYPAVDNYNSFSPNEIDGNTFRDDPLGVSEDWPYEWMSRREKKGGVWGTFLSPARLWSNWAPKGDEGESAYTVEVDHSMFVVDADHEGNLSEQVTLSLDCWLKCKGEKQILKTNSCVFKYGGSTIPNNWYAVGLQDLRKNGASVQITLDTTTAHSTKDIYIKLVSTDGHVVERTVPVIINREGADGRNVFRSIVFMRSNTKPNKPQNSDGSYSSPVPSGTWNDGGVTRQWSDGVDAGTLPVWMTSRIFASDGQTPPQESAWSDVTLMKDIDGTFDVEFTDASENASVGTPSSPASGVTWYDPVNDAGYLSSHAMNWMATRTRVTSGGTPSWGPWVVNRIRGEKGNDGAGQAYVAAIPDKIVIDCNGESKSKRYVLVTVTVYLMWGDEKCALKSSCNVNYSGGGTVTRSAFQQGDDQLEFEFEVANNAAIQSGLIQVTLVGTDSNSVEHVAALSIPVNVNVQGAKGVKGSVLRFRGAWSDSEYYVYNDTFRDCVKYNGSYYIMSDYTYGLPGMQTQEPDSDTQSWDNIGNMQFVATELLLAEQGTIQNLVADYIRTAVTGERVEMYGNVAKFFGRGAKPNIEMKVDADGVACLRFYDKDGNMLYDLGPRGIDWLRTTVIPARFAQTYTQYVKMSNGQPDKSTSTTGQAYLYQFNAQRTNGAIEADNDYATTAAIATAADGKYFTFSNVAIPNNTLADGLYRSSSAPILTYSSGERASDVQGMQTELMNTYGLTQSQINAFDWTTGGALYTLVKNIKMQAYVSFASGVQSDKIAIWQENNSNASFLVDAV